MLIEVRQGVHLDHFIPVIPRLLRIEKVLTGLLHHGLHGRLLRRRALRLRQVEAARLGLLSLSFLVLFLEDVVIKLLLRLLERAGAGRGRVMHLRARARDLHRIVEGVVGAAAQQVLGPRVRAALLLLETVLRVLLVKIRLIYRKLLVFHSFFEIYIFSNIYSFFKD